MDVQIIYQGTTISMLQNEVTKQNLIDGFQLQHEPRVLRVSILKVILGVLGTSFLAFLIFKEHIFSSLGRGGAEVAAEVVKSEKLQKQVNESVADILQKLSNEAQTHQILIELLGRIGDDPKTHNVTQDIAKEALRKLLKEEWVKKEMENFVLQVLKDLSQNEEAKQALSSFFQEVLSRQDLQSTAGTGIRKAVKYAIVGAPKTVPKVEEKTDSSTN